MTFVFLRSLENAEDNLSRESLLSSGKEEKGMGDRSQRDPEKSEFCVFLFSLFKQLSVALPWLQRTNFRDLSAAHAE